MTITYIQNMSDVEGFGNFWKLLFRWKGSVYKLIWKDMTVYSVLYFTLSIVYRYVLNSEQRKTFERVAEYCNYFSGILPVGFVLGFYVNIVVSRWWSQFEKIPFTDPVCLSVITLLNGQDDRSREMRRQIARYVNLAVTMLFFQISPSAKVRFPTKQHIVDAGLMTQREKHIIEEMSEHSKYVAYWLPLLWAEDICAQAHNEGKIRDTVALTFIMTQVEELRGKCSLLVGFDRHNIPLVYTQVVTMAVYAFCLSCIMGRQFINPEDNKYEHRYIDIYIPLFTFLQFFFFLGWLKVAESLVHPFGEDDDDFEVNWILDKNMQVAFMMVDGKYRPYPEMVRDKYWTKEQPQVCPWPTPYPVDEQIKREQAEGLRSKGNDEARRQSMFNFLGKLPCTSENNVNIRGQRPGPEQRYSIQRLPSQLEKIEVSSPKTTSNFTSTTSIPSCCSHASPQVRNRQSCVDDGNTIASFSQNYQDPSVTQNNSQRQVNPSFFEDFQDNDDTEASTQKKNNYIPSITRSKELDNVCSSASTTSIDPTAPPLSPNDISSSSSSPYDNSQSHSVPPVGFCINSATPSPSPSMRNRSRSENPNLWDYTQSQSIPKNSASSPASLYPPHPLGDSFNATSSPGALYSSQENENQSNLNNSLKRGSLYYSATSNPSASYSYSPTDNPQQSQPFQIRSPQFSNYSPSTEYPQIKNNELRLRSNAPSPSSYRSNTPSPCPDTYINMYPVLSDSAANPLSLSAPSNLNKTSPRQDVRRCDASAQPSRPTSLDIPQHLSTMEDTLENNSNFQPIQKHSPLHSNSPSSPQLKQNGNELSSKQNGRSNSLNCDTVLNTEPLNIKT
ncbi:unnamed protein product [Meganyctiphanes norvegica]|uniref:Bestrophin homolog n=1 Tax=Meganyctiphanes norvegica TaxID=48144 RepID=A0AAV2QZ96_MEGNR